MLRLTIFSAAILIGITAGVGIGFQRSEPVTGAAESAARVPPATPQLQASRAEPAEMVLDADSSGHYFVDAEVNGETIRFLVDTGASMVALSRDDAALIGLRPGSADFSRRARTANGIARVAPVTIDQIEVGDISVNNVPGAVIDLPMEHSLLGMSFLSRLSGYEVSGRQLILRP